MTSGLRGLVLTELDNKKEVKRAKVAPTFSCGRHRLLLSKFRLRAPATYMVLERNQ